MRDRTFTSVVFAGLAGVIGNSLYDVFKRFNESDSWRPLAVSVIAFAVLAIVLSRRFRRRIEDMRRILVIPPLAAPGPRRKCLVAFVSVGNGRTSALQAAEYHLGTLEHLWLITSTQGKPDAEWVKQQLVANPTAASLKIHDTVIIDDILSIAEAKVKVEMIRRQAMRVDKVKEPEIVCDFTGLNKLASAGMILACAPRTALLQYMYANEYLNGQPNHAAGSTPREIPIAYRVAEEEDEEDE